MIAVFTTELPTNTQALQTLALLKVLAPTASINFDLSDGEKILRIDGSRASVKMITGYLIRSGIRCEILA
jgi:hypothetical protein